MKFEKRFKEIREQAGLSQRKLAQRLNLKSTSYISRIEDDVKPVIPSADMLYKIATIFASAIAEASEMDATELELAIRSELFQLARKVEPAVLEILTSRYMDFAPVLYRIQKLDRNELEQLSLSLDLKAQIDGE